MSRFQVGLSSHLGKQGETQSHDIFNECQSAAQSIKACYVGLHFPSPGSTFVIPTISDSGLLSRGLKTEVGRGRNHSVTATIGASPQRPIVTPTAPDLYRGSTMPSPQLANRAQTTLGMTEENEYNSLRDSIARDLLRSTDLREKTVKIPSLGIAVTMMLIERDQDSLGSPLRTALIGSESLDDARDLPGFSPKLPGSPGHALRGRSLSSSSTQTPSASVAHGHFSQHRSTGLHPNLAHYSLFAHGPKFAEMVTQIDSSSSGIPRSESDPQAEIVKSVKTTNITGGGFSDCVVTRERGAADVIVPSRRKEVSGILEVVLPLNHPSLTSAEDLSAPAVSLTAAAEAHRLSSTSKQAGDTHAREADEVFMRHAMARARRRLAFFTVSFLASSEYASIAAGSDATAMSLISAYSNPVFDGLDNFSTKPTPTGPAGTGNAMAKRSRSNSSFIMPCTIQRNTVPLKAMPEEPDGSQGTPHTAAEDFDTFTPELFEEAKFDPSRQFIVRASGGTAGHGRGRSGSQSGIYSQPHSPSEAEAADVNIPQGKPGGGRTRSTGSFSSAKFVNQLFDTHEPPLRETSERQFSPSLIPSKIAADDDLGQVDVSSSAKIEQAADKALDQVEEKHLSQEDSNTMPSFDRHASAAPTLPPDQIVVKGGAVDVSEGEDGINWGSFLPLGLISQLDKCFARDCLVPSEKSSSRDFIPIRDFAEKAVQFNKALVYAKMKEATKGGQWLTTAYDDDFSMVRFNLYHIYESPQDHPFKAPRDSLLFAAYAVALATLKQNLIGKRKGPIYLIPATGTNIFGDRSIMTLQLEATKDVAGGAWGELCLPETYAVASDGGVDNDEESSDDDSSASMPRPIPSAQTPVTSSSSSSTPTPQNASQSSSSNPTPDIAWSSPDSQAAQRKEMREVSNRTQQRRENSALDAATGTGAMTRRGLVPLSSDGRFQDLDTSQYIGFKFYTDLFDLARSGKHDQSDCNATKSNEDQRDKELSLHDGGSVISSMDVDHRRRSGRVSGTYSLAPNRRTSRNFSTDGHSGPPPMHTRSNSCTPLPELIRNASTASVDTSRRGTLSISPIDSFRRQMNVFSSFGWPMVESVELSTFRSESFDVLAYTEDQLLVLVAYLFESIWRGVDPIRLRKFLLAVRRNYRRNPFHNLHHGMNVVHFIYMVLYRTPEYVDMLDSRHTRTLGMSEPNATFVEHRGTELDVIALLLAGLCHDIDHPGNNNLYEVNSSSPLALLHNDSAVLEHHHASITMALLRNPELNIFADVPQAELRVLRSTIISCILGTDMALHFENCNKLATSPVYTELKITDPSRPARKFFFETLVHTADICGQVYPLDIAEEWESRISEEFMIQSLVEVVQGLPVAPYMLNLHHPLQRYKGQVAFLTAILLPWWNQLVKIFKGNKAIKFYYEHLEKNLAQYTVLANRAAAFEDIMDALVAGARDAVTQLEREKP